MMSRITVRVIILRGKKEIFILYISQMLSEITRDHWRSLRAPLMIPIYELLIGF